MTHHSGTPKTARAVIGALIASAALLLTACGGSAGSTAGAAGDGGAGSTRLVVAEPAHSLGYLPLYVAIDAGFFAEEGLEVEAVTLQGGGAHTNAVLTGQAWAFIGGPEHNAFAAARDNAVIIKAVTNVVNKGNVYLVAKKGLEYTGDLGSFLEGKTIVTGAAGGTPHSITSYLLAENGLESGKDVTLIESADTNAALAIIKQGQAEVAVVSEPVLGRGVTEGIWDEPFYNVPEELGAYAYSTINVREDSYTEDPETALAFIRGLQKALELVKTDKAAAVDIARKEFPTLEPEVLEETIDRALADELWEWTGEITPESVDMALNVVRAAGILDDAGKPVQFEDIVDASFWEQATAQ